MAFKIPNKIETGINVAYHHISARFRAKRVAGIHHVLAGRQRVVDFGGIQRQWDGINWDGDLTIVNLDPSAVNDTVKYRFIVGDACVTSFHDKEFDLSFSNSAIEHVGNIDKQREFAGEMLRVGKNVYCQTPNRYSLFDPHFLSLFVHWFPGLLNHYFVVRYLTLWGWMTGADKQRAMQYRATVNLLTEKEFSELFPSCRIVKEKFLFFTKSLIAIG